MKDSCEFSPSN